MWPSPLIIYIQETWDIGDIGIGPAQDVTFFYTHSHLSVLQSCALIIWKTFSLFSHLNSALHNLVIELCSALKISKFLTVI